MTPAAGSRLLPAWSELLDPAGPWLVPLLLMLATRAIGALLMPLAAEDAYITFRYARNLAAGNGLSFNPGERVLGFTSMPWTLWSTLGYLAIKDPALWARATNLIADAVVILVMGRLLMLHAGRWSAATFTFFYAAWPYFTAVSASGMESTTFLALIALTAGLAHAGHGVATGIALGLTACMRPEGIVAALVLSLWVRPRARLIAASILAAGLAATWAYFGTVVPQSLTTKVAVYGAGGPWLGRHWWEWLSPVPMGRWPETGDTNHLILLTVLLAPAALVGTRALIAARRAPLVGAVAAMVAVWMGYAVIGVAYFWWYLAVPLAGVAALAAVGMPRLVRGAPIPVTAALVVLGMWVIGPKLYLGRAANEQGFATVARFLERNAKVGDHVMLEPIGIIGYFAPLRVTDEVGLVSPAVTRRRFQGGGWYHDLVGQLQPDWLVVRQGTMRTGAAFAGAGAPFRSAAERESLLTRYDRVLPEGGDPGDAELVVYHRAR